MEGFGTGRSLTSTAKRARWIALLSVGVAIVGIIVLFALAASEVAADPSLSLEDGYWIGRLPWTPVGVGLVLTGSTTAVIAGTVAVLLLGGNHRRILVLATSLPPLVWWSIDVLQLQGVSGSCLDGDCFRPYIDPIANAYSLPQATVLLLLVPATIVVLQSLTARPARRRTGLAA